MKQKILISDDDPSIRAAIALILGDSGYELVEADSLEMTEKLVQTDPPDLLLLDVHFGSKTSIGLLEQLIKKGSMPPTIVLSGAASASEAARAIKLGAYDFIEKPISADRLRTTIDHCLETNSLRVQAQSVAVTRPVEAPLIGKSAAIQAITRQIERLAPKDIKVLITGETGVGKDVVAQLIWKSSQRSERPLVVVNCAAIPENLVESELFGHKKGSFTGALTDQLGKIEMADHGTLFLDEIGDLSQAAQTKLLRFLETGEIQKLGSNQVRKVDVRVIAATSRELEKEMEKGYFRSDLFYRLNVGRLHLSPLRDRREDIAPLFTYFVDRICARLGETKKEIDQTALELLLTQEWRGNGRELRNVAERAVLIADKRIMKEHLEGLLPRSHAGERSAAMTLESIIPLKQYKTKVEKDYIEAVLALSQGSVTRAAAALGIDRTYLHQKMATHKIAMKRSSR